VLKQLQAFQLIWAGLDVVMHSTHLCGVTMITRGECAYARLGCAQCLFYSFTMASSADQLDLHGLLPSERLLTLPANKVTSS